MRTVLILIILLAGFLPSMAFAKESDADVYRERMALYRKMDALTQIPWYYYAAIDQYERSIRSVRRDLPKADGLTAIYIKNQEWAGYLNPNPDAKDLLSITIFNGKGVDGNGDGVADMTTGEDVLFAMAQFLQPYGSDEENFRIALWDYYKRDKAVSLIMEKAQLYKTFGKLELDEKAFPLPSRFNYSYKNTWGDARGWGGRRIHEGTDIFADYGVPVRATCYGVIEMKGWNKYGGWRLGIRDINNTYHYFAHLSGFAKDLQVGGVVKPGQLIGGVGSSGYGPPGTSGKFPPHLHYGMYKDNGLIEWSFDPYPYLRIWERNNQS
ncbi:M23 family metallopeptidase [Falsibacillus pallidus]|uniref:M23 family metallopeptidase n=1 Tax=Falsibacillus pallidus TaxID=493781 RepID=UPI003D996CCD